jgi:ribonuclease BN (tRNA processing enzyme)
VQLTVLGCAGTYPGPDSACSSYLVEHDGFRLVLDMGAGSLGELQKHADLLDVDAVYVSHLHADHCIDLVAYSYARRYHPGGLPPRLPVYGPAGLAERMCGAFEAPPVDGLRGVYDFREVPVGSRRIGPFTVTSARTNHPVECHALRVEADGRSLTYSGDSATSDALVDLARGTDLFLCEATWPDAPGNPPGLHLSGREAGEHAARAGVGSLVLTHIVPWADREAIAAEARSAFTGTVQVAHRGTVYLV